MTASRPGMVPVAALALGAACLASGCVAFGALSANGSAASVSVGASIDASTDGSEPGEPTAWRAGPAPRAVTSPQRDWPRHKPRRALPPGVRKALPVGAVVLAPDEPVGITDARDAAGGRSDLLEDYAATLVRAREEAGYTALVLAKGEGVVTLLGRAGLDRADVEAAVLALSDAADLTQLQPGDTVEVATRPAVVTTAQVAAGAAPRRLVRVRVRPEPGATVVAWRDAEGWTARREEAPVRPRYATASTVITDSLFAAGARADVPAEILARTANLFLYDVDFARDVRRGDRFEVVYEALYDAQGRPMGTGDVVFAAMTWRGGREAKAYYRFDAADTGETGASEAAAYFDASGESARRLLMKTPIEGARVTSRFGPRRHPTLGYRKNHRGVDFGARTGTPIMAAGDGVVVRANRFGSFGNYLRIRHANGYETAYAHLHGFASGVRKGARVRQGDVVAFVGSTGRSTGPHLHYEVHRAGEALNPMTLDMDGGAVLAGEALAAFEGVVGTVDAMRAWPHAVAAASGD